MTQSDLTDPELGRLYRRRVAGRWTGGAGCASPGAMLGVVRGEGGEAGRLATLEHVMSCAACHREYQWLAAVDEAAIGAGGDAAARRPWWRRAPLALAASLAVALAVGLLVRSRPHQAPEPLRGAGGDIVLVAPAAGAAGAGDVTFVWRQLPGAPAYVVEVQRADGSIAFSDTTADTTLTLAEPGRVLSRAEYRWWVRELTDGGEPRSSAFGTLRPIR